MHRKRDASNEGIREMVKFVVLYHASQSTLDQMSDASPEQAQAGMDAWMAWAVRAGDAVVDLGAPLGAAVSIGPSSASSEGDLVCGFSILQSESKDSLIALLGEHPHLNMGGSIELLEFLPMSGA
jgi:hypothetical protein